MSRRNLILAVLAVLIAVEVLVPDRYERVMEVHLEVLGGMAQKIGAIAAAGRRPTPNDLTELIYPLERARQFVDGYESYRDRGSYASFVELIATYEEFVDEIDSARSQPDRWDGFLPKVPAEVARIEAGVEQVRQALAREE